jgi:hypothetical protein
VTKKHNVKFKVIDLENGVKYATDQNMNKSLRAHFVDGFNGRPFTKKSRHSPSYFAYEKGDILRIWIGNIRNEFLQYGTVNAIQVAAAVIKKLAPEGLCRNCELNNEVTPATLPAGDLADDIKEQTRGLCDACRTLQIEQSPDADARDSIR